MNALTTWLNNKYVITVLALFTACYAGLAAPKPSAEFKKVLTSDWFRFIIIFLIAYLPKKNFHLSLMIAIGFSVTYILLKQADIFENFLDHEAGME